MAATIKLEKLSKKYGDKTAVAELSTEFYAGQIVALLGENGAGKSTLLNMMAGFLAPTSGRVLIEGDDIAQHPEKCKKKIGFLPEGSPLYDDMRVNDFLAYMSELKGVGPAAVATAIAQANLDEVQTSKIDTLSKGYRRRVGFAVSLLCNPPILLLDEPSDGLDPNQKAHLLGLITDMSKQKTIIISTHLLDEAEQIANRIMIMHQGEIKIDGDKDALCKQTRTISLENAFVKLTR
ncbi:MAG: ABC transporter ATP-binding protein [Alphaproteobacteria bacterium]|nr:ABC transporter ATP-binding protein [Alphaproteobacteria bacterium]